MHTWDHGVYYVPKIWGKVDAEDSGKAEVIDGNTDSEGPEHHSNIRKNDLTEVVGSEHRCRGLKIWHRYLTIIAARH